MVTKLISSKCKYRSWLIAHYELILYTQGEAAKFESVQRVFKLFVYGKHTFNFKDGLKGNVKSVENFATKLLKG